MTRSEMMRRGRFAPTPSGFLHIGNALTALLAWLQMRAVGGQFLLRIEDVDEGRSRQEFARQMVDELRWLGIDWDEGPDVGGPVGPYEQRARTSLYAAAFRELERNGYLYPCFCSRADLAQVAATMNVSFAEPVYPGTCRQLTKAQRSKLLAQKSPSMRFSFAASDMGVSDTGASDIGSMVRFLDLVQGSQAVSPSSLGDFVVRRADGLFAYQLAVVVDDAAMGVTDVLRGADLLISTPRQLALYRALGQAPPTFGHVPLVVDADGNKLSKRNRSITLAYLRQSGIPAERVVGVLGFLAGLLDEPMDAQPKDLVERFDVARLPRQPIRFTKACEAMLGI